MLAALTVLVILYLLIDDKYRLYNTKTHRWNKPTEENKVGYFLVAILFFSWLAFWFVFL